MDYKWIPYQELAEHLVSLFDEVVFVQVPRDKNSLADALATLAFIVEMPLYRSMESLVVEKLYQPAYLFIQPSPKSYNSLKNKKGPPHQGFQANYS